MGQHTMGNCRLAGSNRSWSAVPIRGSKLRGGVAKTGRGRGGGGLVAALGSVGGEARAAESSSGAAGVGLTQPTAPPIRSAKPKAVAVR